MGYDKHESNSFLRFKKVYGDIIAITVYEIEHNGKIETWWDMDIVMPIFDNEILSSASLNGHSLKEHKQAISEMFCELEIIDTMCEHH